MQKPFFYLIGFAVFVISLGPSTIQAESYTFSFSEWDPSSNGTGAATMDFTVDGSTVTVKVNNTSPLYLGNPDDPSNPVSTSNDLNAPAITGFGFNLADSAGNPLIFDIVPSGNVLSWGLTGYSDQAGTQQVIIGGTDPSSTNDWVASSFLSSVSFDFLPQTGNGSKGGLYNPAILPGAPVGGTPRYFTEAVLTLHLDSPPDPKSILSPLPFVRMQNVGRNGAGSLKIDGVDTTTPNPISSVPEPSSWCLMAVSLVIGLFWSRKRIASGLVSK